jgi:hypothetical protein
MGALKYSASRIKLRMRWTIGILLLISLAGCTPSRKVETELVRLPAMASLVEGFVSSLRVDSIDGIYPEATIAAVSPGLVRVTLRFQLEDSVCQDDWKIAIKPAFKPTFFWSPHLSPTDKNIIAQHVFRAPALIVSDGQKQLTIMPDLDLLRTKPPLKWYMDLDAPDNILTIGLSRSKVTEHVLFERDSGMCLPPSFEVGFYIMTDTDSASLADPWRRPLAFQWELWGKPLFKQGEPIEGSLEPYVKHTYNWAFRTWSRNVWQEFDLGKKKVGAPVFIVNVTQSPNYTGDINEREFRSIWNQAWFSSLRSAQGLYRYAKRTNDTELLQKAIMTKELALLFPQRDGLFPSVIATDMETIEVNGKKVSRSKGWETYYFGNSNRNPIEEWRSAEEAPLHILDMSWTAYLMLTWYDELEKDERLKAYAKRYADKLITLQDSTGFFPAWLDIETLEPLPHLKQSPETSMSVTFLLKMFKASGEKKYLDAAEKAMNAVIEHIVPASRWEDFETYWSCSSVFDSLLGKRISRNNAFKQNTFSMYWTAEALLNFYNESKNKNYLSTGQRVLDELLMYQAAWQPPFIPINALGGFGVMNADGEWNDSRQSLFAELIVLYGKALNNEEYIQRGLAALRASFVMMYCPENPETKAQWEKVYPFFNERDYGFMMENYGHGGETNNQGLGIGEFTIYDWGNGAAAEAYNRMLDHLGEAIVNGELGQVAR